MSLDFHLSKKEKDAPFLKPSISISEEEHSILFELNIKTPMLLRLQDYYKNAKYRIDGIKILINEIDNLKKEKNITSQQNIILEKIKGICLKALTINENIYVYCD